MINKIVLIDFINRAKRLDGETNATRERQDL